jgi:hypothetical protein
MAEIDNQETKVSRRDVFGIGSAALAAATLTIAGAREASVSSQEQRSAGHNAPNEIDPGHIDGPKHRWFQDERYYDLIVILDDASSEIYYAQLVNE